jgi:hypothetical protein
MPTLFPPKHPEIVWLPAFPGVENIIGNLSGARPMISFAGLKLTVKFPLYLLVVALQGAGLQTTSVNAIDETVRDSDIADAGAPAFTTGGAVLSDFLGVYHTISNSVPVEA